MCQIQQQIWGPSQQQEKAGEVEPNHQQDQGGQTSIESLVGFETHKLVDEKCKGSRSQDPAQTGNHTPRRNKGPPQTLRRKGPVADLYTQVEKEKKQDPATGGVDGLQVGLKRSTGVDCNLLQQLLDEPVPQTKKNFSIC